MTDRPILFSAPMVLALLAGTKTQTRRVMSPQPSGIASATRFMNASWELAPESNRCSVDFKAPRFAVGDRLYVREAWQTHAAYDDISPAAMGGDEAIRYAADGAHQTWGYLAISKIGRFRQGMHMPRWASRLTLTVTDLRVQRLQEISESDAVAEGCPVCTIPGTLGHPLCQVGFNEMGTPLFWYRKLWNHLNDARGFGWDSNPWVAAVSFMPERRNIDQVAG